MTLRLLPLTLAACALLPFYVAAQDEATRTADITQTIDFERYLIEEGDLDSVLRGANQKSMLKNIDLEPDSSATSQVLFVPINFVNASSDVLALKHYEKLIEQLDEVFDFEEYDTPLKRIQFCLASVRISNGQEPKKEKSKKVKEDQKTKRKDLFDPIKLKLRQGGRLLAKDAVNILIVDGTEDLLGFSATVPHRGETDIIVIASDLVKGSIPGRDQGKTVAQLIANYFGLKPIWYNETGEGDYVDDTPCHNAPNFGEYPKDGV